MNLNEFNSLVDLFFHQVEKENSDTLFLEWLNPKNKKIFSFSSIKLYIIKKIGEVFFFLKQDNYVI